MNFGNIFRRRSFGALCQRLRVVELHISMYCIQEVRGGTPQSQIAPFWAGSLNLIFDIFSKGNRGVAGRGDSLDLHTLMLSLSAHFVAPYYAIPRDYLSDTPLLRAMGFFGVSTVDSTWPIVCDTPSPFLSIFLLESM